MIVSHVWGHRKPFVMAVFVSFSLILLCITRGAEGGGVQEGGILGGPDEASVLRTAAQEAPFSIGEPIAALLAQPVVDNEGKERFNAGFSSEYGKGGYGASLLDAREISHEEEGTGGVFTYIVKRGDTVAKIAKALGVPPQAIASANPGISMKSLREGREIAILPVSGILHQMKEGETPESVAASYGITIAALAGANASTDLNNVGQGTALVIPGAHGGAVSSASALSGALPDLGGYFGEPAEGFNWGRLHAKNAVDIANACGTPVTAAAEGLVFPDGLCDTSEGWNGGYGTCVSLEHPNGTKTRYAHLSKANVSVGDYVEKGKAIGAMGESGEATGCHLHFEVEGAKNPRAK